MLSKRFDLRNIAFALALMVVLAAFGVAATSHTGRIDVGAANPATCSVGDVFFQTATTISLYECLALNTWTQVANVSGSFANQALSNLTTTSINSALLPNAAAAFDFGSAALPWKNLWFAGASLTPATNNFEITGTATAARVITFPDNSGTAAELNFAQTWSAAQTFNNADFLLAGATSGTTTLEATAAASGIATFPANTGIVAELNLAQTWTAIQTSSSGFVDTSATFKAKRVTETGGTALVATDFALSAGFGSTGAIATITGTDGAWQGTVTPGGTGIAASPTLTLTFHDGTWTNPPICVSKIVGGTGSVTDLTEAPTATTNVITFQGLPVSGSTYTFASVCIGR